MMINNNSKKIEKVASLWKTKNILPKILQQKKSEGDCIMLFGRRISNVVPNSVEEITLSSQRLCEDYIEARLGRSGIRDYVNQYPNADEYFHVVKNMGLILEIKYPRLYNKISGHLKLTFDREIVVWDSFNKFGRNLFSDGITWAKIIAFFAFTGGLSVDVMRQRKSDLIGRIIYWFSVFVMKNLSGWIQNQGGWKAVVDHFNNEPQSDEEEETAENIIEKVLQFTEHHQSIVIYTTLVLLFIFILFLLYLWSFS